MSGPGKRNAQISTVFRAEKWIPRRTAKPAVCDKPSDQQSNDIHILQQFDLNWEYGPCINITRLERWNRAHKLGLNPPKIVKDLILEHPIDSNYTECIWNKYPVLK